MRKFGKGMSALLVSAMLLSAVAGCSSSPSSSSTSSSSGSSSTASTTAAASSASTEGSSSAAGPDLSEKVKLVWYQNNNSGGQLKSHGESECYKAYAEKANVEIEWQHPADGSNGNEQLNLIIASNQLPDVIFWNWKGMPGGIAKYITDKVALPLNDLLDTYAPDYKAAMDKYPEVAKVIPLDDGTIPAFYQMDPDPRRTTYSGHLVRKDWLDKLGLSVPETMDDWYNTLVAFRDQDPNGNGEKDEIPWTESKDNNLSAFTSAYGILNGMYINQDTQKVDYGPIAPTYKDFLTTMNKWYTEGLIDPEFATNDSKMLTAKMVGNRGGSTHGYVGGGVGNYTKAARVDTPEYSLVGIPAPKAPNGISYMPQNDSKMKIGEGAIITTKCKNPERAAALINYGYSEEGGTLLNYGIEGESYEVKDGKKTFVDAILNPEEGKSRTQAVVHFAFPTAGFAKVMDYEAQAQIQYEVAEQTESIENWLKSDNALQLHPNILLTADESSQYSMIYNEIKTYVSEMTLKFILGTEPLDNFDQYAASVKGMGVEEAIKIQQDAYDRLMNR